MNRVIQSGLLAVDGYSNLATVGMGCAGGDGGGDRDGGDGGD